MMAVIEIVLVMATIVIAWFIGFSIGAGIANKRWSEAARKRGLTEKAEHCDRYFWKADRTLVPPFEPNHEKIIP